MRLAGDAFRCVAALALVWAGWLVAGCRKKAPADLVIISPHHKNVEKEFEQAFRAWHREALGRDVKLEWIDRGGTSAITRSLIAEYKTSDSSGIDLYFGGGGPDHKYLTAEGITLPVKLPDEIMAQIPETIGGVRQYDRQGHWHGAAVSCVGILYNTKLLKAANLPVPKTWDDLAAAAMYRRIEAANAAESGSARLAYEMIVQSAPDWPAGWAKLLKVFGNSKRFTGGASDVAADVAYGEVLAGAAIDFYALTQVAKYGDDLGFVVVAGTTAFTPDPISLLKGAPHGEMARRFMEFVLSRRGQGLWCLPPGEPEGPAQHALYRQPIRRDVYQQYKGRMLPRLVDPFEISGTFKLDEAAAELRISRLHGPLMKAAALDNREALSRAWKVILDAGEPDGLVKEFIALPPDLADEAAALEAADKLADDKQRSAITLAWQRFFREKYQRIIEAKGGQ